MNLLRGWGGMKVSSWRKVPLLLLGYDIRRWEAPGGGDLYDPTLVKKVACLEENPGYGPTHLQKHSPFGFLFVWPLCFHVWWQFREQTPNIPGSEIVAYFRIGFARWDAGDSCYMVPTLFIGGHWD